MAGDLARYLERHAAKALTIVLLAQAALFYGFTQSEHIPAAKPLGNFSFGSSPWLPVRDEPLDKETLDVLKADDTLSRVYQNRQTGQVVQLFVAYFATQRTGKTPHSPKNCLPGSGWVPTQSGTMHVTIPGEAQPITINRYLVSREESQDLVLYWYQSHNRVVASEYRAKLFTIFDSMRYRRSDTSLVRVVDPVTDGDAESATDAAVSFIKALFVPLKNYLPS
jgi:EpsI family protein